MKTPLILVALLAALALPGCAATELVASGVKRYCGATTEAERQVVRERVALAVAPHRIKVECADDLP